MSCRFSSVPVFFCASQVQYVLIGYLVRTHAQSLIFKHSLRHAASADYTPSCRARLRVSVSLGLLHSSAFRCFDVPPPSSCGIAPSGLGGLPVVPYVVPRSRRIAVVSFSPFASAVFELCWLDSRHAASVAAVVCPVGSSPSLSPRRWDPLTGVLAGDVNAAARPAGLVAKRWCR